MIKSFLFKICPNIDDENYYNNMIIIKRSKLFFLFLLKRQVEDLL